MWFCFPVTIGVGEEYYNHNDELRISYKLNYFGYGRSFCRGLDKAQELQALVEAKPHQLFKKATKPDTTGNSDNTSAQSEIPVDDVI